MANWDKIESTGNVEDRRGSPGMVGGGVGLLGVVLIVGLTLLTGGNDPAVNEALNQITSSQTTAQTQPVDSSDTYFSFATKVLGSSNTLWKPIVENLGVEFNEPRLVLFRQATQSGCGGADSSVGPHYCPEDATIYLDETFFDELTTRFGAKGGDVAEAYVIAHEIGHHIQTLVGTTTEVQRRLNEDPSIANELSIAQELQADCYAGFWVRSVEDQNVIAANEIDEAIDAASVVGDDKIQKNSGSRVNPETWTHGSSAQRKQWFKTGFETGDPGNCNTF